MAFSFDESPVVTPWTADVPEEITMERLIHVRSFGLWAATNDEQPLMHLSPRPQPIQPPATPRRRHSVTSLSPSPKSKSPKKKKKPNFFLTDYEPERLVGQQLMRDVLDSIDIRHEAALSSPPSSINDIFEKLETFGFHSDIVEDCKSSFATLVIDYDPEFVLSALLGDPLRRLVKLIIEERVKDYDESRQFTIQPPISVSKHHQLVAAPLTKTSSDHSQPKPNPLTSRTSSGDQSTSSTAVTSSQRVPTSSADDDDEPSKPHNPDKIHVPEATKKAPIPRPHWVKEVDELAKMNNTKIVFVDSPPIPLRNHPKIDGNIGNFYRTTKMIGNVTIYHGCRVRDDLQDIDVKLRSFILTGVDIDRGDVRGFLSNSRAVYFSNSIDYAFIWPVIQTRFAVYRRYTQETMPKVPVLIVCQNIDVEETLPGSSRFSCWRIPPWSTGEYKGCATSIAHFVSQPNLSVRQHKHDLVTIWDKTTFPTGHYKERLFNDYRSFALFQH
jgi:hypothetical protein